MFTISKHEPRVVIINRRKYWAKVFADGKKILKNREQEGILILF